jgi:hypothetical protein
VDVAALAVAGSATALATGLGAIPVRGRDVHVGKLRGAGVMLLLAVTLDVE